MCEFCENIMEIKEENIYDTHPLKAETEEFPKRQKLILAKKNGRIIFYGFNKYAFESDAVYKLEPKFCPMCGRKLTDEENTVEMKPVIHAHAIIDWLGNPKCSNCGDTGINAAEPYCQHCGATFDESEERIV